MLNAIAGSEDEAESEEDMDLPDSDDERDQTKHAEAVGRAAELDKASRRWTYTVPVDAKERKLLMAELVKATLCVSPGNHNVIYVVMLAAGGVSC